MAAIGSYKPVKLVKYTITKDVKGNNVEAIEARYRMWADVSDSGGGRSTERGQVNLNTTKVFLIHFRPDWKLNADWKIQYYGKEYSISSIERVNEKRFNWRVTANA